MIPPPPTNWPGLDGNAVGCREKLKMLAENYAEVSQVLRDAFEDAILMGVDEAAMRQILADIVAGPGFPKAARRMKLIWLAAIGLTMAAPAWAQRSPVQAEQLPPLQQQWQQEGSPPVQQGPQAGAGPTGQDQGAESQSQPLPGAQPSQSTAATAQPNIWVPAQIAKLQALDKVNAQATALTIKVGQSAVLGSLTITVKACMVRPTDQPADAAAYLDVTDSHPDSPGFMAGCWKPSPRSR